MGPCLLRTNSSDCPGDTRTSTSALMVLSQPALLQVVASESPEYGTDSAVNNVKSEVLSLSSRWTFFNNTIGGTPCCSLPILRGAE